jgi:hypothetical protein
MPRKIVTITATLVSLLLCLAADLAAQADRTASTYHVFPQVADGFLPDGSFFQTSILVTSLANQNTICTYSLYGLNTSRLLGPNQFTLLGVGAWNYLPTSGSQFPLTSGYGTVSCNGPVTATAFYTYSTSVGLAAFATVFSSQSATVAELFVNKTARLGVAIANDTSAAASFLVIVDDSSGNEVGRTTVSVNSKSSIAGFIDTLISLPPGFGGTVAIISPSGVPFNAIGLSFSGNNFTTLPATVLQ